MKIDICDLILAEKSAIKPTDLVGVRLKHPYFGLGRIHAYCCECQRVAVEFEDSATVLHEDLYDILGEVSCWKVSVKQLERKFGHLHKSSKAALKRAHAITGNLPSSSKGTPKTSYIPISKTKQPSKIKGPPLGAKPLIESFHTAPLLPRPIKLARKRKLKVPALAKGLPILVNGKQAPVVNVQSSTSSSKVQGKAIVANKAKSKPNENLEKQHRHLMAHDDFETMDDGEDYDRYQDVDFGGDGGDDEDGDD